MMSYYVKPNKNSTIYMIIITNLVLIISTCLCKSNSTPKEENVEVNNLISSNLSEFPSIILSSTESTPLSSTVESTSDTLTTKESTEITKAYEAESSTAVDSKSRGGNIGTIIQYVNNASRQKINSTLRAFGSTLHSVPSLSARLGAIDCDLPLLPRTSRLWRGNETHELNLPITECPQVSVSWEASADIQSGDILIVRISDSLLLDTTSREGNNESIDTNSTHTERTHQAVSQPAVYQVTRLGHEHCDLSDGMLLDISPLDERASKIFTLYDKDLTEGVNLLIVVSEKWGSQCIRLKVTVKSDNCGESQDCSGNGVCYTNVSMEGYECQCCKGYMGPRCDERDACNPSPCLNNGI
ncbi:unnamed protein product [Leptidea sinapis]|uniref:EGF-like domain-containing protein n=1 Tax=Leptidea sinapis TaxID=189913 RepID=A0A5E4PN87_9NEOP|nr:unnamed protein product [Leptidea sinapis]